MLLFQFVGLLLLRFATRRLLSLLFQPPPRSTLGSVCPYVKRSYRPRYASFDGLFLRFHPPISRPNSSILPAAYSNCPRLRHSRSWLRRT